MNVKTKTITVNGAGIAGLWAALVLAQRGHDVRLVEKQPDLFLDAASSRAGAMIAPYCEAESAGSMVQAAGLEALRIWQDVVPGFKTRGTLVVAPRRDQGELKRFARLTQGHQTLDADAIQELEPELAGQFTSALFFRDEGHISPDQAMRQLIKAFEALGGRLDKGRRAARDGPPRDGPLRAGDYVLDCRGIAACSELANLRGVRGELVHIRSRDISLHRPVRLLHPRFPIYIVPHGGGNHMIGATMIESADNGPVTVRSALELLSAAYAVHPGFAEAEICGLDHGIRPAFPDNLPKIIVRGNYIHVNGLYRHGFLLAPVLARLVADVIEQGRDAPDPYGLIKYEEMA